METKMLLDDVVHLDELDEKYNNEPSTELLAQIISEQSVFRGKMDVLAKNCDYDALDSSFYFYMYLERDTEGVCKANYEKLASVFGKREAWSQDIRFAVAVATYCAKTGNASAIHEMVDYFQSCTPDGNNSEEMKKQRANLIVLRFAETVAEGINYDKNNDRVNRLRAFSKAANDLTSECENNPDSIDEKISTTLSVFFSELDEEVFLVCLSIGNKVCSFLDKKETISSAMKEVYFEAIIQIIYHYDNSDLPEKLTYVYYWEAVLLAFERMKMDKDEARDWYNEFYDELNTKLTSTGTFQDISGLNLSAKDKEDTFERMRKCCVYFSVNNMAGAFVGLSYLYFFFANYSGVLKLLEDKMPLIVNQYPIARFLYALCRYQVKQIDYNALVGELNKELPRLTQEKNEDDQWCYIDILGQMSDTNLLVDFVCYMDKNCPSAYISALAGDYYMDSGLKCYSLEKAYNSYDTSAKLGNEDSAEKLTHFKRSLFGKLQYK